MPEEPLSWTESGHRDRVAVPTDVRFCNLPSWVPKRKDERENPTDPGPTQEQVGEEDLSRTRTTSVECDPRGEKKDGYPNAEISPKKDILRQRDWVGRNVALHRSSQQQHLSTVLISIRIADSALSLLDFNLRVVEEDRECALCHVTDPGEMTIPATFRRRTGGATGTKVEQSLNPAS